MAESENLFYVCLSLLQVHCQRSYGVMCDLGDCVLENEISVYLFQEPYVREGRVCGLPACARVFLSESGGSAIAVFNREYECMPVEECKFSDGVCVWVNGAVGELLIVSLYCKPNGNIYECLDYLDSVLRVARGLRVLIGMDANATSDVWFSKNIHRDRRHARRGVAVGDWIVGLGLDVLNVPTTAYNFCGARGRSDIDVSLFGGRGCRFDSEVMSGWSVSDHSPIMIRMNSLAVEGSVHARTNAGWFVDSCDLESYRGLIGSYAFVYGYDRYREFGATEKVGILHEWIVATNDALLKRVRTNGSRRRGVVWWCLELSIKRNEVRRKRKKYQHERERTGDPSRMKWHEYRESMKGYKRMIKEAKEKDWHEFVRRESASDP